jgi:DNA-binding NarL/FixJ family response regulator
MRTVLLLTDEPVVAAGLRCLIEGSNNVLLDPMSLDSENLGERLRVAGPDLVLITWNQDLSLTALDRLFGNPPECPVLLVARNPSPALAYQAKEAGYRGLLDSRSSRSDILSNLARCGHDNIAFHCPPGMELRPARAVRLSARQGQLVRLLAQGLKNKEIATSLGLTEGTVKVYLSKLFKKAGVKDRFELALFGLKYMVGAGDAAATRSAVSSASPNGGNHGPGLRTLVLSKFKTDDTPPYQVIVSSTTRTQVAPVNAGPDRR